MIYRTNTCVIECNDFHYDDDDDDDDDDDNVKSLWMIALSMVCQYGILNFSIVPPTWQR